MGQSNSNEKLSCEDVGRKADPFGAEIKTSEGSIPAPWQTRIGSRRVFYPDDELQSQTVSRASNATSTSEGLSDIYFEPVVHKNIFRKIDPTEQDPLEASGSKGHIEDRIPKLPLLEISQKPNERLVVVELQDPVSNSTVFIPKTVERDEETQQQRSPSENTKPSTVAIELPVPNPTPPPSLYKCEEEAQQQRTLSQNTNLSHEPVELQHLTTESANVILIAQTTVCKHKEESQRQQSPSENIGLGSQLVELHKSATAIATPISQTTVCERETQQQQPQQHSPSQGTDLSSVPPNLQNSSARKEQKTTWGASLIAQQGDTKWGASLIPQAEARDSEELTQQEQQQQAPLENNLRTPLTLQPRTISRTSNATSRTNSRISTVGDRTDSRTSNATSTSEGLSDINFDPVVHKPLRSGPPGSNIHPLHQIPRVQLELLALNQRVGGVGRTVPPPDPYEKVRDVTVVTSKDVIHVLDKSDLGRRKPKRLIGKHAEDRRVCNFPTVAEICPDDDDVADHILRENHHDGHRIMGLGLGT